MGYKMSKSAIMTVSPSITVNDAVPTYGGITHRGEMEIYYLSINRNSMFYMFYICQNLGGRREKGGDN